MRIHTTDKGDVSFTAPEEAQRDAEEASWLVAVPDRAIKHLTTDIKAQLLEAVLVDDQLAVTNLRSQFKQLKGV